MEIQVPNGVLHGVQNGKVHEQAVLHAVYVVVDGEVVQGCKHKMACLDAR